HGLLMHPRFPLSPCSLHDCNGNRLKSGEKKRYGFPCIEESAAIFRQLRPDCFAAWSAEKASSMLSPGMASIGNAAIPALNRTGIERSFSTSTNGVRLS